MERTINQYNGRAKAMQSVNLYRHLSNDRTGNYRNDYWRCPDGHTRTLTGCGIYCTALKEQRAATGYTQYDRPIQGQVVSIGTLKIFELRVDLVVRFTGMYLEYTNDRYNWLPKGRNMELIRSHSRPSEFDLKAYAQAYFMQHLPSTIIGRIMEVNNCTKKEAKELLIKIKYSCDLEDRPDRDEMEIQGLRKLLKRQCNIKTEGIERLSTLQRAWKQYKGTRSKYRRELRTFNPFRLHDELTMDYDDDDDIMNAANVIINNPKIAWI